MTMPKRIQRLRTKGWRMPPGCIYVGRPTKWGNPFLVTQTRYAQQAIRAYRMGVRGRWSALEKLEGINPVVMLSVIAYFQRIRRSIEDLRSRDLCCWCRLDSTCHADVLLEIANA